MPETFLGYYSDRREKKSLKYKYIKENSCLKIIPQRNVYRSSILGNIFQLKVESIKLK